MDNLIQFPIQRVEKQTIVPTDVYEARAIEHWNALGYDRSTIALRMVDFRLNVKLMSETAAREYPK